jgi:hypothetical protein
MFIRRLTENALTHHGDWTASLRHDYLISSAGSQKTTLPILDVGPTDQNMTILSRPPDHRKGPYLLRRFGSLIET